ncbi:DUF2939 domain-containing protein [Massilia sp. TW-1]|uniref:DUF2939 domain-containing protein n=1 Tax=Telluria antibiotica TaxID=2717319 RepID=A0ABX0PDX8_9BURK|nr:DUF2939 domain-containing protein [Telluria antibiotica]NIA55230.1 DUF2939 domain-containing protein [Telluria antibiotica]
MNRIRTLAAATLLAIAATSAASPWWTLHRLQAAVARHDADAVAAQVDFPALRASVKEQAFAAMGGKAGEAAGGRDGANPFAAFGRKMAMAVVDPLVDAAVSPEGVATMVEHGRIGIGRPAPAADTSDTSDSAPARDKPRYALAYRGLNSFAVTARDGGSFIFRRDGLWTWKLAGIDLARGQ